MSSRPAGVGSASLGATVALARPAMLRLLASALLGACAIGATIALMGTSAWMLSRASQRPGEAALGVAIVAVQFFGLSRGFFRYGERLVGHDAAFRLLERMRVRFFEHLETLAPAGLPAFSRGELVTRMVADVDGIEELLLRVVPPFATALVVGIGTVAVMWWLLPAAGVVTLVALVLAATAVPWLTRTLAKRAATREADLRGELATSFVDLVEGAAELVVYGATPHVVTRVTEADASLRRASSQSASTSGVGLALTTLLAGLAATVNLAFGAAAVHSGRLSGVLLGTLAVVPLAAFELVAPLPAATQALHRARQSAERIQEVLDTPAPVLDPPAPVELVGSTHTVSLNGVWASYPAATAPVLRGIDLVLEPGRFVAVVGPSGAGKSTIASVLVDFLAPSAGTAFVDGRPYGAYRGDDVRRVVGLVDQLPHLFDTTLAANLRVASPDASDDQLVAALGAVGLSELLASLPSGLETQVGRTGSRLSGGQRQRVGVARALLADWPVLVLDEPTEHLEPDAADALVRHLVDTSGARATVLITHRLVGLDRADEILVVDAGRVIERGTHDELLELAGRYAASLFDERSADAAVAHPHDSRPRMLSTGASKETNTGGSNHHG